MTIAILATGDEIIHGDTLNTNAHAIAHTLCSEGLPLGNHMVCSDKETDLFESIAFLRQHHDTIITIGGLGPTSDDRTRFALADCFNLTLVEHPEAIAHIQTRLNRAGLKMNAGNRQQALFPEKSQLLPNPYGTAMGGFYQHNGKRVILLPGPPKECLPMFHRYALPLLIQQLPHSHKQILKWRLFGVPEGEMADSLDTALAGIDCKTGYRLDMPYLEFKVRCHPSDVDKVQRIIEPLVKPHLVTITDQKVSDHLRQTLAQWQKPIVILDEVSGGHLQTVLQQPETYAWVRFQAQDKAWVYFHLTGLNAYWHGKADTTTTVTIQYQWDAKEKTETHELPYRSNTFMLGYVVEWLSFRLFQILDELHQSVA